ncbi:MAG: hypothetical protein R2791_12425 [Saprospiraceae bacterium]
MESILKNNLFGLDIDKRAAQLAQFALLLKAAAKRPEILKKACAPTYAMPEPRPFSRQEVLVSWAKTASPTPTNSSETPCTWCDSKHPRSIMRFDLPEAAVTYIARRWRHFQEAEDLNFHEKTLLPALSAYLPVLLTLCDKYEAVVANPPYMGRGEYE